MSDKTVPILCVNREVIEPYFSKGVKTIFEKDEISRLYVDAILNQIWIPRNEAEEQLKYIQIIPYVVYRTVLDERLKRPCYLRYGRARGSGEKALVGRESYGAGGHIEMSDAKTGTLSYEEYQEAMHRELTEEFIFSSDLKKNAFCLCGALWERDGDVGERHLGFVHMITEVGHQIVQPKDEKEIAYCEMVPEVMLLKRVITLEGWSRTLVDNWEDMIFLANILTETVFVKSRESITGLF